MEQLFAVENPLLWVRNFHAITGRLSTHWSAGLTFQGADSMALRAECEFIRSKLLLR